MIDIKAVEEDIKAHERHQEESHSLAYELLREVKASSKRWFIIAMIELVIILAIVGGMIWYNSLPVEDYNATIHTEGDENNVIGIGDSYGYNSESVSENTAW